MQLKDKSLKNHVIRCSNPFKMGMHNQATAKWSMEIILKCLSSAPKTHMKATCVGINNQKHTKTCNPATCTCYQPVGHVMFEITVNHSKMFQEIRGSDRQRRAPKPNLLPSPARGPGVILVRWSAWAIDCDRAQKMKVATWNWLVV